MCKFIRSSNNNAFYLNKTAINRLLNREESITMISGGKKKKKKNSIRQTHQCIKLDIQDYASLNTV